MIDHAANVIRADNTTTFSRVLPFVTFMAFIAVEEGIQFASARGWVAVDPTSLYYLYPLKTVLVALLLYRHLGMYQELRLRDLRLSETLAACAVGVAVFVMWITLDWSLSVTGEPKGFNPTLLPSGPVRVLLTTIRAAGAVLVVPLMEELFWRSWLLRYLVRPDFEAVPLGTFTWPSFLATVLLFGLEHHFVLAGMVAGAAYNGVMYLTRSVAQCVVAHAVTNLLLAIYVISTGSWRFW